MRRNGTRHRQRCHAGNVTACCYLGALPLVSYRTSGLCPSEAEFGCGQRSRCSKSHVAHIHILQTPSEGSMHSRDTLLKRVAAVDVFGSACLTASDQHSRRMTSVSPVCIIIAAADVQTLQASLSRAFAFSQYFQANFSLMKLSQATT